MRRRPDRKAESIGDARMQSPPGAGAASRARVSAAAARRGSGHGRRPRPLVLLASVLLATGMIGCASDGDEIADTTETTSTTTTSTTSTTTTTTTSTTTTRSTTAPTTTTAEDEPWIYGDDPTMDALWDRCEAGDAAACDELYAISPVGSEYETFGFTCGGRTDGGGCDDTTDGSEPPPDGTGGDIEGLCGVAAADIAEVPTGGLDPSDFALEETAVAQILYRLSDELAAAGAGDLSGAVQTYGDARSDLALAYDQGGLDEANAAQAAVDTAAEGVVDAAAAANAPACADITG